MLERICRWVYRGGILVRLGRAPLRTVDQRDDYEQWFARTAARRLASLPERSAGAWGGYVVDVRDVPNRQAFAALMDQVLVDAPGSAGGSCARRASWARRAASPPHVVTCSS